MDAGLCQCPSDKIRESDGGPTLLGGTVPGHATIITRSHLGKALTSFVSSRCRRFLAVS